MNDEEILQSMRETFRVNPDATPIQAVVEADADPDRWLDAAETLADGGDAEIPEELEADDESGADESGGTDLNQQNSAEDDPVLVNDDGPWGDVDWSAPESGVYPDALLDREQWMARDGKLPFAPWGDRDAPAECNTADCPADRADEARCDRDARRKWGYEEFYRDGETVAMAEADPKIDGRAYIQRARDPFSFVDGDDVRDPETGAVHPAFVDILNRFGLTYADVSTSGTGVHANYEGELPNDIPDLDLPADVAFEGSELSRAVTAADLVGDHVSLAADADEQTFTVSAEGDTDDVEVVLGNDELATAEVPEAVESLYSLDYLEDMARPIGSDVIVSFRLGSEMPVKFRYTNGEASVEHLLAPRIESS